MKVSFKLFLASMAFAALAGCSKEPSYLQDHSGNTPLSETKQNAGSKPEAIVFKAAGDITSALNEFRATLGTLNTAPGAEGGRREINWDGVPAGLTNNDQFPGDFFAAVD